jgi:hypothetical protein
MIGSVSGFPFLGLSVNSERETRNPERETRYGLRITSIRLAGIAILYKA